jgi:hypothetical protein
MTANATIMLRRAYKSVIDSPDSSQVLVIVRVQLVSHPKSAASLPQVCSRVRQLHGCYFWSGWTRLS